MEANANANDEKPSPNAYQTHTHKIDSLFESAHQTYKNRDMHAIFTCIAIFSALFLDQSLIVFAVVLHCRYLTHSKQDVYFQRLLRSVAVERFGLFL